MTITCENCGTIMPDPDQSIVPVMKLTNATLRSMIDNSGFDFSALPDMAGTTAGRVGHSSSSVARVLVDLYYSMQDLRKAVANKLRAIDQGADVDASDDDEVGSSAVSRFVLSQIDVLECNSRGFVEEYATRHALYPWLSAVHGLGPVLAGGLLAHLGARPVPPTVGHWWRFAGLDPSQQWLAADKLKVLWRESSGDIEMRTRVIAHMIGRDPETVLRDATTNFRTGETTKLTKDKAVKSLARIPYNRPLKTLCWKVGDQFVKLGTKQNAFYAQYYRNRKAKEIARNEAGERAGLAAATLKAKPKHAQAAVYAQGKLPDGRVDLMARRATVKLFLSHLHDIWFHAQNGEAPPHPFSSAIQGHAHYIPVPYEDAANQVKALGYRKVKKAA